MRRWLAWGIVIVFALSVAISFRSHRKSEARRGREARYAAILNGYVQDLKPGMTRKQVEDYLRLRGSRFTQGSVSGNAFTDFVKIGEEEAPWFCSENWVHIAFEFAAAQAHDALEAYDGDVLKTVTIFRQLGGCL